MLNHKISARIIAIYLPQFHPISEKTKYEDYDDLQVNHINGETDENGLLSNHSDNLEWTSSSENMMHSYKQSLNKKQ
jgi:hypothetical protein